MFDSQIPLVRPISRRAALRGAAAAGALAATGRFAGGAAAQNWSFVRGQATPAADTPPELPDTALGRELASWLEAVNSHDPDTLLAHYENYVPPAEVESSAAFSLMISKPWDTLILRRIDEESETRISALVEATLSEEWLTINIERDGERQAFDLMPAEPLPGALPDEPLDDDALAAELERYLAKLVEADVFSGAVLVARDGEPLFTGAYGQANAAPKTPNRLSTRFNLGSMNKMVTSVAIAQLQEAGDLAFDGPDRPAPARLPERGGGGAGHDPPPADPHLGARRLLRAAVRGGEGVARHAAATTCRSSSTSRSSSSRGRATSTATPASSSSA